MWAGLVKDNPHPDLKNDANRMLLGPLFDEAKLMLQPRPSIPHSLCAAHVDVFPTLSSSLPKVLAVRGIKFEARDMDGGDCSTELQVTWKFRWKVFSLNFFPEWGCKILGLGNSGLLLLC